MKRAPREEDWFGICELREDIENTLGQRCPNRHELDDLVQETLIKAAYCRPSLDDPQRLRAWVLRIAWNVFRDHVRREHRFRQVSVTEEEMEGIEASQHAIHGTGTARLMKLDGVLFDVEEVLEVVRTLVGELTEPERILYSAYYREGLGCSSTAQRLGTNPKRIKMRLFRLRKKIRAQMRRQTNMPARGRKLGLEAVA